MFTDKEINLSLIKQVKNRLKLLWSSLHEFKALI